MTEPRADVQTEHGHIRIANRLYEALLDADMTNRQKVICHGLLRVTYGWRQHSATLTHDEFAQAAGMTNGGTFREAVRELVAEGVILIVDQGSAGRASTFAIQKDFTRWGRFSVAPERLRRRFGIRPPNLDHMLKAAAQPQAAPEQGTEPPAAHGEAALLPSGRQHPRLPVGSTTGSNGTSSNELTPPKDMKDNERQRTTATAAADSVSPEADFALGITTAANQAVTRKWGEQTRPYFYGMSTDLAAELMAEGVPLATAQRAITDQVEKSKAPKPPSVITYFRNGILEAARTDEQRRLDRANPVLVAQSRERGGPPTSLAYSLSTVQLERDEREVATKYDELRREAARTWAEDPAHAVQVAAIHAAAKAAAVLDITTGMGKRAYEADVIARIAVAAGFPDFDTWKSGQPGG